MTGLDLKAYYGRATGIVAFWRAQGGLSLAQACGMLAQADAESSLNPLAIGDHGHAFGLHQWHEDRVAAIKAGCGVDLRESPAPALEEQLKAALWELTHTEKLAWRNLRMCKTAYDAGYVACRFWERPGSQAQWDKRGKTAEKWLAHFQPPPVIAKVA